jgi:hypothetical protein
MPRSRGRNYTYRIPLDDRRAFSKVRVAEKIMGRLIEWNPKDVLQDTVFPPRYEVVRTFDREGPLPGLGKYRYSSDWEKFPLRPGRFERLEMRHGNGGGTKLRGEVYVGGGECCPYRGDRIPINTTVSFTPGEIKAMVDGEDVPDPDYVSTDRMIDADEALQTLYMEIDWAIEDADERLSEEYWEAEAETA